MRRNILILSIRVLRRGNRSKLKRKKQRTRGIASKKGQIIIIGKELYEKEDIALK